MRCPLSAQMAEHRRRCLQASAARLEYLRTRTPEAEAAYRLALTALALCENSLLWQVPLEFGALISALSPTASL